MLNLRFFTKHLHECYNFVRDIETSMPESIEMTFNFPQLPIKNTLLRHLVWVGIFKLILLYALWFAFFRDRAVHVDEQTAADQILSTKQPSNEEPQR